MTTVVQRHNDILFGILNESTRKVVPKSTVKKKKHWMTTAILSKMEERHKVKGVNETLNKKKK